MTTTQHESEDDLSRFVDDLYGASTVHRREERVSINPAASEAYDLLLKELAKCSTVAELFKLAASDEFKAEAQALPLELLKNLRTEYRERQTALDGKVKLETFDGQIVNVVNIDWWHSDQFADESKGQTGDGVTLHIRTERDPSKKYKCLTSSVAIVRFANSLSELPTETAPVRVLLALKPVSDAQRAAKGQKVWTIKRLSSPTQDATDGFPF